MIKKIEFQNLKGCLEISNGDARLFIPTVFGPRVLYYGFDDGENVFGWHPGRRSKPNSAPELDLP